MGAPDWIFDFTGIRVAAIFSVPTGFGAEYPILGALRNTKSQKEHFVIAPVFRLKFVTLHEVIRESRHMNNLYEERLGTDRMLPLVFRMALPAVAAQIVNLLYNIVDRIYIGHIPGIGTDALAGIGVTSSVIILISAFSSIVGAGGAPLAAIALGQGDRERAGKIDVQGARAGAGKILGTGLVLLLLFTVLTSATAYLSMRPLLMAIGASEHTIGYAMDYLSVYLLGTLFVEVSVGLNTFINTQGRPGIAMCSVVIGALLNIGLDPLFIFVFGMGGERGGPGHHPLARRLAVPGGCCIS